jgi:hypothetical protein
MTVSSQLPEELLIDFQELIGEHSGENMADIVWKTLEDYKLVGRVRHFPRKQLATHELFRLLPS